jgi:hypothetical protein
MRWRKLGKIFEASGQHGWMNSHAQIPTVLVLEDRLRVYFATRPEAGQSLTGFFDLDLEDPTRLLYLHDRPILALGDDGAFDEHGIMPNHAFVHEGRVHLFYVGWSRRDSIPYSNWNGLAVSGDGGRTFEKAYRGPILDRTRDEIYSATGLICLKHSDLWYGWYASGTKWVRRDGGYEHIYDIRACRSRNLVDWERPNAPVLPVCRPDEANTRPSVAFIDGKWHMWFCYRGTRDFRDGEDSYRIGYAWSRDLEDWVREDDEAGLPPSPEGWDSTMVAYPYVVDAGGRFLMFYNGNGFGKTGIGCALLEGSS